MAATRTVSLHRSAPAKPIPGAPCNGCGLCCAAETCPAGRLLFLQARGPCPALVWQEDAERYRCGLVTDPGRYLRWLPRTWQGAAGRLFRRWIAAGRGCDSEIEEIQAE